MKASLLALLLFALTAFLPAFALAGTGYSAISGYTYGGTGTELPLFPLRTCGSDSPITSLPTALKDCSDGYEACTYTFTYNQDNPDCVPNAADIYDADGISSSMQTPSSKQDVPDHVYYAIVYTTDSLTANPSSITAGDSATLTWSGQTSEPSPLANGVTCSINNGVGSVTVSNGTEFIHGSTTVDPATTTTYTLTCDVPSAEPLENPVSVTASAKVTVNNNGPLPDLTAGSISPTSAAVGVAQTLTSSISNIGNAATGVGFNNLFQKANDAEGDGAVNLGTDSVAALDAGGNEPASLLHTFNTAGTYYVRACANTTNNKNFGPPDESNYNNNCGAWTAFTVTVNNGPLPDLTAGSISPTSAAVGVAQTLTSSISNIGNAATGVGFNNLFQKANDAEGDGAVNLGTDSVAALDAGGNEPASLLHTFNTAGTYYVRACANTTNNKNFGPPDESNYNNNCGAWTAFTVSTALPDLIASDVTTNPPSPAVGVAATLSATVTNQGLVGTGGPFTDLFEIVDQQDYNNGNVVQVTASETYNSKAVGAGKSNTPTAQYYFPTPGTWYLRACADLPPFPDGVIEESNEDNNCSPDWAVVTVNATQSPYVTCSPSPSDPATGQTVTWTASAYNFSGTPSFSWSAPGGSPDTGTGISFPNTYATAGIKATQVTASDENGDNADSYCYVDVSGGNQNGCGGEPTPTISAAPNLVPQGATATVSWSAQNVETSCTITSSDSSESQFPQTDNESACTLNGSATPTINEQTQFCITCDNDLQTTACAVVNINPNMKEY